MLVAGWLIAIPVPFLLILGPTWGWIVAVTALATGYIAAEYGLRPGPFLLGAAFIASGLGPRASSPP